MGPVSTPATRRKRRPWHRHGSIRDLICVAFILSISHSSDLQAEDSPFSESLRLGSGLVIGLAFGDIDGDGDIDFARGGYSGGVFGSPDWFENLGGDPPIFLSHELIGHWTGTTVHGILDLDRDGDADIIAHDIFRGFFQYTNDGGSPPQFSIQTLFTPPHQVTLAALADIDLDGDVDFLVNMINTDAGDPEIVWYEQIGFSPFSFAEHDVADSSFRLSSLLVADINGDSNPDFISSLFVGDPMGVTWYKSDGAALPTFETIPIGPTSGSVRIADLDGDGDQDIVTSPTWFENGGGLSPFFTQRSIGDSAPDRGYDVGDIDLDGDVDLIGRSSTASDTKEVHWFENNGDSPPTFDFHVVGNAFREPGGFRFFDLDLDGDLDCIYSVTACSRALCNGSSHWFRNGTIDRNAVSYELWDQYP